MVTDIHSNSSGIWSLNWRVPLMHAAVSHCCCYRQLRPAVGRQEPSLYLSFKLSMKLRERGRRGRRDGRRESRDLPRRQLH